MTRPVAPDRAALVAEAAAGWQRDLTDLSGRNPLLYFRDLRAGTLDLGRARPDALGRLIAGRKVRLSALFDNDSDLTEDARKRIVTIHRAARSNFEERGIETLHIVYGLAKWTEDSSTQSIPAAPVLMCPLTVNMQNRTDRDPALQAADDWFVNSSLLYKLRNGFRLDIDPDELVPDGHSLEETEFNSAAAEAVLAELKRRAAAVHGFDVVRRLVVGNFAYRKLAMVTDIENSAEALAASDLVATLAGHATTAEQLRTADGPPPPRPLLDATPASMERLVLDADSSQHMAIHTALAGKSFVLQGPPGTGKSQTIANLMASMMASGRKLLFVAEKRAAIDAVLKRLELVGLRDLVFDAHGGVMSKRAIAEDVGRAIDRIETVLPSDETGLREHDALRQELAAYEDALHRVRAPWGVSYFDTIQRLMGLHREDCPSPREAATAGRLRFVGPDLHQWSPERVSDAISRLTAWAEHAGTLRAGSPWLGAPLETHEQAASALALAVDIAAVAAPATATEIERICKALGETSREKLIDLGVFNGLIAEAARYAHARGELALTDNVSLEELQQWAADLGPARSGGFAAFWATLWSASYRGAKKAIRRAAQDAGVTMPEWSKCAELVATLSASGAALHSAVGHPPSVAADALLPARPAVSLLAARCTQAEDLLPGDWRSLRQLSQIMAVSGMLAADDRTAYLVPEVAAIKAECGTGTLGRLLALAEAGQIELSSVPRLFPWILLRSIQSQILAESPELATFDGERHRRIIAEFQHHDSHLLRTSPSRVARRTAETAIRVMSDNPEQTGLLRNESRKRSRHKPLKRLLTEAPDVFTAIKPIWAMSPLDVAHLLPLPNEQRGFLFDLVVFDEASQILPCDSVPALARAPQAMIAGDSRQLPPTTFFSLSSDDPDDDSYDDTTTAYESLLDVMDARLGRKMLTWHYRSHDERLIAFSNTHMYRGALTTFPNAANSRCISHTLVPSRRPSEKGSSPDEVLHVVDMILEHARTRPGQTLGVIAFGSHHSNQIEALLDRRLAEDDRPELRRFFNTAQHEPPFIKPLERVQGDERDYIILSVGYGWDRNGKLPHRFGPLNMEGGERRLNVAVTRARQSLTLVSSFTHAHIDPRRASAEGARLLRAYLKYAESGGRELDRSRAEVPLNAFELDIKDKLEAAGLAVEPQYGASGYRIDFAVRHPNDPGRFILAVEADGTAYHAAPSARDRDRLRQEHLERLGWTFCRIWSTDWFRDHQSEVRRVLAAVHSAVAADSLRRNRAAQHHLHSHIGASPEDSTEASRAAHRLGARTEGPAHATVAGGTAPDGLESSAARRPPRTRPKPRSIEENRGLDISAFSHAQLVEIARWVMSDGLLRTKVTLIEAVYAELHYRRRGSKIRSAIEAAVAEVLGDGTAP